MLRNKWFVLLLVLGTISWSLTMVKSGIVYEFGMGFWGANGHDGVWHIALSQSLSRGNFEMPTYAGLQIRNYHIGFDLILANLHKLTSIPVVNLYFQVIPPLIALLIGIATYGFVINWKQSKAQALWSMFFVYFAGDMAWVFGRGESTFWAQQAISTLINPPFALSLILLLLGFGLIINSRQKINLILATLIFGALFEIKAYAGLLALAGLLISGIWEVLRDKKFNLIKVFGGSLVLSLVIFLVFNSGSQNVFEFAPFWFLEILFTSDRFDWPRMHSAIINYKLAGNWIKLIPAYILAFIIFWVGNMWTRLFKEFEVVEWIKNIKNISTIDVFFTSVIVVGGIIPMLFVQKGTPWNTIQFFYYSLFFSAILAGTSVAKIKNKSVLIIVVLLTIPTSIITLANNYIPDRPPAKISNKELSALSFLSKQDSGVVLTYPFDKDAAKKAENNPPRPLYLYDSTAYVSAFGDKPVFLEDEVNLNITGFNWRQRRVEIEDFLNTLDQHKAREFLIKNNIEYIYWLTNQRAKLGESQLGLTKIFENSEVNIFKVN